LLASPLATFTPGVAELLREALGRIVPVLRTLGAVIGNALGSMRSTACHIPEGPEGL